MTMAMCFNCGETKFGALCPCPECQAESTGDITLDIASAIITCPSRPSAVRRGRPAIRRICDDDAVRFWSFISFVSTRHADVLHVEHDPEMSERCAEVLLLADPPPVVFRESAGRQDDARAQGKIGRRLRR